MPSFKYVVKTHDGRVIQSSLEAADRKDAVARIRERADGVLVRIEEPGAPLSGSDAASMQPPAPRHSGRIRPRDLTLFFRQLAISVNAGLPLRDSMESIVQDLEHDALHQVLSRIVTRLHEGRTFSQALADQGRVFPRLCVTLVATAEEAGSMGRTLDQLAGSLEKSEALSRKIRSITAYPMFMVAFFIIVMVVMTLFVLPQFQEAFSGWGARLPLLTRVVFGINRLIISHIVIIGLTLGIGIAAVVLYVRTNGGRMRFDRFKLSLHWFGVCFRKVALARFCKNLAVMIRGGVPIASAIEITSAVCGNQVMEHALRSARERILLGSDFAHSLAREGVFPNLLVRMVGIGESSGRLPEVLDRIADGYEVDVEGSIVVATSLFEPVVIVFFGAIILAIVMAIYLPVFTAGASMR